MHTPTIINICHKFCFFKHWHSYITDTQANKIFKFIHFYYFLVVFIVKIVAMDDDKILTPTIITEDDWDNHIGDSICF
jgi:hypothetical protein